jgi:hypothetical protein
MQPERAPTRQLSDDEQNHDHDHDERDRTVRDAHALPSILPGRFEMGDVSRNRSSDFTFR